MRKKLIIFTLVYGFTYSHWYRSDRWPTHPWALTNIHNKCVNRVKHFLANTHILLLSYTPFKVACIISAFFISPVFDSSSEKNECGGRTQLHFSKESSCQSVGWQPAWARIIKPFYIHLPGKCHFILGNLMGRCSR